MSTDNKSPSGADLDAGSDTENPKKTDKDTSRDSVSFETYQKVLDQKKKRDAELSETKQRLQALEDAQKEREDADLKAKENYKALAERAENKLKEKDAKLQAIESKIQDSQKMSAFLSSVSGNIEKQYWNLVDLEKIAIDQETGEPDLDSVKAAAKEFEATYPAVIQRKSTGKLPTDAAKGGGAKLAYEEWLKLPLDQKKARYGEVFS